MNTFEFMHRESGEVIERQFRIGTAPRSVRCKGRRYYRIPSRPALAHLSDNVNGRGTDFLGQSIDPAHHKFHTGRFHTNEHGERLPVFSSKSDREAFRSAAAKEGVVYEYGTHRSVERP